MLSKEEEREIEDIGKEPWQHYDYGLDAGERESLDSYNLVIDYLQNIARTTGPRVGPWFYVAALNTDIVLDFTTEMGGCSNMYWGYVFQMPKWSFNVAKVAESMEVSPIHAEAYNLFAGQRQRIEGQIKQGLVSAAQAVTDYELLAHDSRRYREILEYFTDEHRRGDEHVLRSMFVDRVDAHTGEGYSMITMAKRWPTIITDFIRMGQKEHMGKTWDLNTIMRDLDVTQAEATVLLTKDRLFQQWKRMFRPTVAERYARIEAMVKARRASIDEYKKWLKPYVVRHKMMKESFEDRGSATNPYMPPALGGAYAYTSIRLWVWKAFPISEFRKPYAKTEFERDGVRWIIDPLDDFVREWARKIEYKYRLRPGHFSDKKIRSLMRNWATKTTMYQADKPVLRMVPSEIYYVLFDLNIERSVTKTPPPAGGEIEDMMINPLRTWIASQNVMVVHLLELEAKDEAFNREIDEMLGTRPIENRYLEETKKMLLDRKDVARKKGSAEEIRDSVIKRYRGTKKRVSPFSRFLIRPGPYESSFYERVVKMYLVDVGGFYSQQVGFWKRLAGVK